MMRFFSSFLRRCCSLLAMLVGSAGAVESPVPLVPEPVYVVTPERIAGLPVEQRRAWQDYMMRSREVALDMAARLQAEVVASGRKEALKAPEGGDFEMSVDPGDEWLGSAEAATLADVVLSFQAPCGGWSKHTGYSKGRRLPGMQWTSQSDPGERPHYLATIDNSSTTQQILFLASVHEKTGRADCAAGAARGLEYLCDAQYPCGGWPQTWPLEGGYHDHITFNDDAMTRVLELLWQIMEDKPHFRCVSPELRARVAATLEKGTRCVLATQIRIAGRPAGWCAQYDPLSLLPEEARLKEPVAMGGPETSSILKFLMREKHPDEARKAAILGGLDWLEHAQIRGLSETRIDGKKAYVADPESTKILWARFYDLSTGEPIFAGADDGVIYDTFGEMAAHNRIGYDYYTSRPLSTVTTGRKKWLKMLEGSK